MEAVRLAAWQQFQNAASVLAQLQRMPTSASDSILKGSEDMSSSLQMCYWGSTRLREISSSGHKLRNMLQGTQTILWAVKEKELVGYPKLRKCFFEDEMSLNAFHKLQEGSQTKFIGS